MVDGTEPDLLADILETRSQHAMLGGQEKRGRMVIEALLAIYSGDNPRIVHHKLLTFFVDYRAPVSGVERPEQRRPEQIQERIDLRITRDLAEMDYGEIAALFTDMAYIRRQCGLDALRPYIDKVDYAMLRRGLEYITSDMPSKQIITALEMQLDAELQGAAIRHRALIAGALAVQSGLDPQQTEHRVREEAACD
jgi:flagellar motor component MotA